LGDEGGWTSLSWASHSRKEQIVQQLLEAGANLHTKDNLKQVALLYLAAAAAGVENVVSLIVAHLTSVLRQTTSDELSESLWPLARYGAVLMVKALLNAEADSKYRDANRQTSLFIAASQKNAPIVGFLLQNK
jgi:ankyrin repeat protein